MITKGSTVLFPQEKLKHYKDEGKLYQKLKAKINQLIQANQAEPIDEKSARLTEDIVCPSPSYAADLCSGASKKWVGILARIKGRAGKVRVNTSIRALPDH